MVVIQTKNSYLPLFLSFALIVLIIAGCASRNTSKWKITGEAMEPNFSDGEIVFVEQIDPSKLQRGDVIVHEYNGATYLKRLIGLPNETIKIHDGKIYVNDEIYDEPYTTTQPSYEVSSLRLGDNEYYVLGDNRDNSADSHVFGPISSEQIIGRIIP
jgi:signal peptidase I